MSGVMRMISRRGRMPAKKTIARRDRRTMDEPDHDEQRPKVRGECAEYKDYCPFVSCKHHLYLDVNPNGSITLNFPHLAVDELEETCALNVADRTALTLQSVGDLMNLTRERARQIELRGMMKMKPGLVEAGVETRPFKRPVDQGYAALATALTAADSKTKITRTQRHILCEMIELTEREGKAPTSREIASHMRQNFHSIRGHLAVLRRHGVIEWACKEKRGMKVCV